MTADSIDIGKDSKTEITERDVNIEATETDNTSKVSDYSIVDDDEASLKSTDGIHETNSDELNEINSSRTEDETPVHQLTPDELERQENPELQTFMEACQKGEITVVEELISSSKIKASDCFSDGVTGLHWAAINNRLNIVKYLCENPFSKIDPNVKGGELKATPLHWACRNGLTYIVHYFLTQTDADPTICDSQSYNALHLSVHSSNILLVIYIVLECCLTNSKKKIYIDAPDSSNRTSLHWAAYQGDSFTVDCLLKFGADASKIDNSLFIPLHWAFMRGHKNVLKQLAEAGSDIFLKNDKGKDSFGVAKDMNCYNTWVQVLNETGRFESNNWIYKDPYIPQKTAKLITFFTPYLLLPLIWKVCSFNQGFVIPKLFIAGVFTIGTVGALNKFIIPCYIRESKALAKSPFLAGIFSATLFWGFITWSYNILPVLFFKKFLTNVIMGGLILINGITFYKSMFMNPGHVPTPSNNSVILEQIYELISLGKYDVTNFSIDTYVRKPLRSKYSRASGKLVARFDHYCPWVYNEIGVRNHKLFMTFIYSLSFIIPLYIYLSLKFFHKYEGGPSSGYDSDDESQKCHFLSENLCIAYQYNNFHFNYIIFICLQFIWLLFLVVTQTFQILRGLTTFEFSNLGKRNIDRMATLPGEFGRESTLRPHSHNTEFGTLLKLLGLDQFAMTLKIFFLSLLGKTPGNHHQYSPLDAIDIPTDYGWKTNLLDFWVLGEHKWRNVFYLPINGENNLNGRVVDYYKLYEYPSKSDIV